MCQECGRGKALPSYAEGGLQLVEALSRIDMLMNGGEVVRRLGVFRFNGAPESASSSKFTGDDGPDGPAGLDDVLQHTIHGIFVKNAKIPVRMNIQLQRF